MAFSLNRAQIIGNLTRDPEVRVAGVQKVATFGVATSFSWMDSATGQRKEKTEFHNVVAWRKLAEICEQYLKRGSKVYIDGRMQTRDWEGEDGVKRYRTEIVVENMIMLDRKGAAVAAPVGGGSASGSGEGSGAGNFDGGYNAAAAGAAVSAMPREKQGLSEAKTGAATATAAETEEEVVIDDLPF